MVGKQKTALTGPKGQSALSEEGLRRALGPSKPRSKIQIAKATAVQHERSPRPHHGHAGLVVGATRTVAGAAVGTGGCRRIYPLLYQPLGLPAYWHPPYHGVHLPHLSAAGVGVGGLGCFGSTTLPSPHHSHTRPRRLPDEEDEVTSSQEVTRRSESPRPASVGVDVDVSRLSSQGSHESAPKLLYLAVRWARTVPSFQQLCSRDQAILLEEAWSSLFVLCAAQWFLPVDEASLVQTCSAPVSRHSQLEEDARRLKDVIAKFSSLRVDHTEYACLKALVLFKAEKRGLREPLHVELLQDQTQVMLGEYCSVQHKARFGKLLLSLLPVNSISRQSLQELFFQRPLGNLPIDRLLKDSQCSI